MTIKVNKSKTVKLVNRMSVRFHIPLTLQYGMMNNSDNKEYARNLTKVSKLRGLLPNESATVDRDKFDLYYKGSKAFRHLVDSKMLEVNGRGKMSGEDLKNPSQAAVPEDLKVKSPNVEVQDKKG